MESTHAYQSGYWPIWNGVFGNSYRGFDTRLTFFALLTDSTCEFGSDSVKMLLAFLPLHVC